MLPVGGGPAPGRPVRPGEWLSSHRSTRGTCLPGPGHSARGAAVRGAAAAARGAGAAARGAGAAARGAGAAARGAAGSFSHPYSPEDAPP